MSLMVDSFTTRRIRSISDLQRHYRFYAGLGALVLLGVSLLVSFVMSRGTVSALSFVWLIFFAGLITCVVQPRYGIYLIVGLLLAGDWIMYSEYPFMKNFSSIESWLYLGPGLSLSPLEIYIVATLGSWLLTGLMKRKLDFRGGPLIWPLLLFTSLVLLMMAYGVGRGGSSYVALWQVRPILMMPLMMVLSTNLLRTRRHVNVLMWVLAIAIGLRGLSGFIYVGTEMKWNLDGAERIGNHHMSIFFVSIGAFLFKESRTKQIWLLLFMPTLLFSFFANQRRASFVALGVCLILITIVIYKEYPKLFWRIAPTAAILGIVYMGVFWNVKGPLGFPAQTFRSVIGMGDTQDEQSNQYRDIENANIMYTIRTAPQGLGFGQKFYIIYPMPDISFFEWWEYITHNALLWMWMQTGPWGFMSMLLLFGMSLYVGGRSIITMPSPMLRNAALTCTLYLISHFIYTYVDMAWDTQSMVYVGTAMGVLSALPRIAAEPEPVPEPRWPWQPPQPPIL
jgi:general stress protein CsbA